MPADLGASQIIRNGARSPTAHAHGGETRSGPNLEIVSFVRASERCARGDPPFLGASRPKNVVPPARFCPQVLAWMLWLGFFSLGFWAFGIWAWLLAIALGFTPTAGVMALAIPYSAILARVFADFLNDVPDSPLNALRSSGASPIQVLIYGRIPLAAKDILSYAFYRFECCLRSAAVLSFIGLQGIGYQIMVSLDDVNFGQVWTLLIFLVAMVVLIDHWGSQIRRNLFS